MLSAELGQGLHERLGVLGWAKASAFCFVLVSVWEAGSGQSFRLEPLFLLVEPLPYLALVTKLVQVVASLPLDLALVLELAQVLVNGLPQMQT
jgi:hypothetical protein